MANRLICRGTSALVAALPNVRFLAGARTFSSYDEPQSTNEDFIFKAISRSDTSYQWPDTRLGPLEPKDHRFPLPGMVGSEKNRNRHSDQKKARYQKPPRFDADVLMAELPHERQSSIFEQFMTVNRQTAESEDHMTNEAKSTALDRLECIAHDCPFLLRKDFFDMFPNCHLHPLDSLTVITFCQKPAKNSNDTNNKLVADSQVDFIAAATKVCEELHHCGFWADFIDSTSGRPYLGAHTNAAVYEVDDRYRRFGFEFDDSIASCRVLRHHALGTRPFVGCVFTSAPVGHPLVTYLAQGRYRQPATI